MGADVETAAAQPARGGVAARSTMLPQADVLATETPVPDRALVLVVDSNPDLLRMIGKVLETDYRVASAATGEDGLAQALALHPDLILGDALMPGVTGQDLLRAVRAHPHLVDVPFLLLTAEADQVARLRALSEGAQDYLSKPFSTVELRARVAIHVMLKRARDTLQRELASTNSNLEELSREVVTRHRDAQTALRVRDEDVREAGHELKTLARRTADLKQAEYDARQAELKLRELNQQVFERRVVERTTELELANKRKSYFLTSMSHELRTPLNAIIGFSEIMLDHDVTEITDEQRKTFLNHILGSGHHLLGLVNDVLDLAKVESGHMALSLESVHLKEVLVGCVDIIRAVSDPKLLTLVTRCEPADAVVTADPARLKQILYNLLSNAVKFTPTGGQISVSAQVDSIEAVIAVRDSGIGIRPEDEAVIFEPFRQAKATLPTPHEGTGLGLALVRELVGLHGGRIWLDSTPRVGSCFTFTLPHAFNLGETHGSQAHVVASDRGLAD